MDKNFIHNSKKLLLAFLKEPGGFSFFPSSFFWDKNIDGLKVGKLYSDFFSSEYSNLEDTNNKVNLYIHIPFCSKICSYCNCFKFLLKKSEEIDKYLDYLEKEINLIIKYNDSKKILINSIFIGGGTPNLLSIEQFKKLFDMLEKYFGFKYIQQILIDGHPNYYNKEKLKYLKSRGVNRVTFAIQSTSIIVLKKNNRDIYDLDILLENLSYCKEIGLNTNIDLLIGLNGQTFESIKSDINFLLNSGVDNISIHYLMKSNNINYKLDDNYLDIIKETKRYLLDIKIPNNSPNITEDYFASKRNTTISLGSSGVTNIFAKAIFIKPGITDYYKSIDAGNIPVFKGNTFGIREEALKNLYLNILYGLNVNSFKLLYGKDILYYFEKEIKFLFSIGILSLNNGMITSNKSDYETLILLNIFFENEIKKYNLEDYNTSDLKNFFLDNGDLIDK